MTCKLIPLTAVCLAVASMPAAAERVLYLDASDPGLNPEETWEDQTEKANNFTNHLLRVHSRISHLVDHLNASQLVLVPILQGHRQGCAIEIYDAL